METTKICPQCKSPLPANAPAGLCPRCVMAMNMATETEVGGGGSSRAEIPSPEELAAKFPQLEILELLGRGGMGAVYKARQKELDRIVALKILPPSVGNDAAFAERFTREARALAKLNHPNIVTLYEFGRADGLYFFLMEFVDGVNIRQLLQTGRVSSREALAIVPQICDALQYAHDQGIVHRDIKPENILMDRRGRVKVADFGLAKLIGGEGRAGHSVPGGVPPVESDTPRTARPSSDLTDPNKMMGTPQYMAPEQKENPLEVDHRADIYALGVVFYQMLTGELPGKRIEAPSKKVQIDVRLDEIVLRALEMKPELRYQSAEEMKTRVETMETAGSAQPSVAAKVSEPERMPKLLWVSIGILAISAVANLVLIQRTGPVTLFDVLFKLGLVFGLRFRYRLAYLAAVVASSFAVVPMVANINEPGLAFLGVLLSAIIVAPILIHTRWFFPPEMSTRRKRIWLVATVVLSLVAIFIGLAAPKSFFQKPKRGGRLIGNALNTFPKVVPGIETEVPGREVEIAIESLDRDVPTRFLDLDLGKTVVPPNQYDQWSRNEREEWLRANEIDLMVLGNGLQPWKLLTPVDNETKFIRIPPEQWSEGLIASAERKPERTETLQFVSQSVELVCLQLQGHRATVAENTFVFETANGARGLIRISGLVLAGGGGQIGLKFRVKPLTAANARVSSDSFIYGTVVEKVVADAIDFDTATMVDLPLPHPLGDRDEKRYEWFNGEAARSWLRLRGMDAVQGNGALMSVDLMLVKLKDGDWSKLSAYEVKQLIDSQVPATDHFSPEGVTAFKTREGAMGVVETKKNPAGPGVAVRFKLIRDNRSGPDEAWSKFKLNGTAAFGPVIERVINDDGARSNFFVDLDRGLAFTPPKGLNLQNQNAFLSWADTNGLDVMGETGQSVRGLVGFGVIARPIPSQRWDAITANDVISDEFFALAQPGLAPVTMSAKGELPETFLFKTRQGGLGVLQITGFSDNPRGVKVRYKMVEARQRPRYDVSALRERVLPDPDNGDGRSNRETLTLRTGELSSVVKDAPGKSGGRMRALMGSDGDMFAEYDDYVSKRWALVTAGLKLSDLTAAQWENPEPNDIDITLTQPTVMQHLKAADATLYLLPDGMLPLTLAFEARDGTRGLLQVTAVHENPRSLTIRYKLLSKRSD